VGGEGVAFSPRSINPMERPMLQSNDLSRSFTALNQDNTLIVVIEMSQSSWLVAGMVPGVERQPLKKLEPDEDQLLKLMNRWRHEAVQTGHAIERVVVAYEPGHDGFWLARWLRERGVEAYVMPHRASPCHVNIGAPRPTASIRNC
jgi:transposase